MKTVLPLLVLGCAGAMWAAPVFRASEAIAVDTRPGLLVSGPSAELAVEATPRLGTGAFCRVTLNERLLVSSAADETCAAVFSTNGLYLLRHDVLSDDEVVTRSLLRYCAAPRDGALVIQEHWESLPDGILADADWLTDLTLSASVTNVPRTAFAGCSNLVSVTLARTDFVASMADAFPDSCASIRSVALDASATAVPDGFFAGCTGLVSVTLNPAAGNLKDVFPDASATLREVTVLGRDPIPARFFDGCLALENVNLPADAVLTYVPADAGTPYGILPTPPVPDDLDADRVVFAGWSVSADADGIIAPDDVVPEGGVTLHPVWKRADGVASFVETELAGDEGGTVTVRVKGGNFDRSSSVKVYLTHGTAALADLDVNRTVVDGRTAKTVTFPVTLKWAAGEVAEKEVVLVLKKDGLPEGPESLTFQLGAELGMALGENRACSVLLNDLSANPLKASVKNPKTTKGVAKVAVTVTGADETHGVVAGTGSWYRGAVLTVKARALAGYAFAGWYSGGVKVSSSASYAFTVKSAKKLEARFSPRLFFRALADPADGGTVTGGGWFAAGKPATLKAVAKPHFRFTGWYAADAADPDRVDPGHRLSGAATWKPVVTNDATVYAVFRAEPRLEVFKSAGGTVTGADRYPAGTRVTLTAKPSAGYAFTGWYDAAGTRRTLFLSCKHTMASSNEILRASFTRESDLLPPVLAWNAATNLLQGVAYTATPRVTGEAAVKITAVTGLPAGLVWKGGAVSGAPTAAATNTVSVKVALATNAKKTWTLRQCLVVERRPAWAAGTFNGGWADGATNQTTLAVSSTGKVSGKIRYATAVWTLSAASIASFSNDVFTVRAKAVCGKSSKTVTVRIGSDELGGWAEAPLFEARQNLWAKDERWRAWAAALNGTVCTNAADGLVVKFGANGTVTARIKSGSNTFSGSAVLCPTSFDEKGVAGRLYLYFAPEAKKKFKGATRVVEKSAE